MAEKIINEIWKMFYGQNLGVTDWHLNEDAEPMDNFFEENDWILDGPVRKKLIIKIKDPALFFSID